MNENNIQPRSTGIDFLRVDFQAGNMTKGKGKHFSMGGDRSIQKDITKLSLDEFDNIDSK